jgi:hypothetical protein
VAGVTALLRFLLRKSERDREEEAEDDARVVAAAVEDPEDTFEDDP